MHYFTTKNGAALRQDVGTFLKTSGLNFQFSKPIYILSGILKRFLLQNFSHSSYDRRQITFSFSILIAFLLDYFQRRIQFVLQLRLIAFRHNNKERLQGIYLVTSVEIIKKSCSSAGATNNKTFFAYTTARCVQTNRVKAKFKQTSKDGKYLYQTKPRIDNLCG